MMVWRRIGDKPLSEPVLGGDVLSFIVLYTTVLLCLNVPDIWDRTYPYHANKITNLLLLIM